jgi:hypothetical protein
MSILLERNYTTISAILRTNISLEATISGYTDREKDRGEPAMEKPELPTCIICNLEKPEGIFILSEFICDDCEAEIVRTDVQDEKYPFFIHQLKVNLILKDA